MVATSGSVCSTASGSVKEYNHSKIIIEKDFRLISLILKTNIVFQIMNETKLIFIQMCIIRKK